MKRNLKATLAALSAAVLLAACGGNDSGPFGEDADPEPSNLSGSLAVTGSDTVARNGVYASDDVHLNEVEKINPIGSDPELCRFRFNRLVGPGGLVMSGDVRYQPGTPTVRVMFISINDADYSRDEPFTATVDRANDEIEFAAAPMSNANGDTIRLTGTIPMRDARPEGC